MRRALDLTLLGSLACVLAALFGLPSLYIPGLAAVLLAALAVTWVTLCAARTRVTLRAGASTVQEGEEVRFSVIVHRGAIPFPAVELLPWPDAEGVRIPAGRHGEVELSAILPRRGRHLLGPACLRVLDPLGLCLRELRSAPQELLVLPRIHPLDASARGCLDRGESGGWRSRLGESAPEIDSLRAYVSGTPASRIHWPSVARTGALIERRFSEEPERPVLVMLDAHAPQSEAALDQALRATASLCVHLARRGGCLLALPGDRRAVPIRSDLRGWPTQHARLALVQPDVRPSRPPPALAGHTVFYVTASAAAAGQPLGRSCYRLSPCPLAGVEVAFTIAGCPAQLVAAGARARARLR